MDERRPEPADERHPENTAAHDEAAHDRENAPLGGDATTEEQLDADNEVEEDALKALNPDDAPA